MLAGIDADLFAVAERFEFGSVRMRDYRWVRSLPAGRSTFGDVRHISPPALCTGSIQPISADQQKALRRYGLSELRKEVERVKHVDVLIEILGVGGVEQDLSLAREGTGRPRRK